MARAAADVPGPLSGERRRLVALAVAMAPGRALALLGRLGDADGPAAIAQAAALTAAPRRARLAALAVALPPAPPRRPGDHPLLARLRLESAARTMVRGAAAPGPRGAADPP